MRRSRRNDKAEYSRLNLNTREAEKYFVILFSEARIIFIDNMQGNNRYFAVIYRDITDNYDKYQKNRNVLDLRYTTMSSPKVDPGGKW